MSTVAIVDYCLGNLHSVQQACLHVGLPAVITSCRRAIIDAAAIILPGVGAFGDAMSNLERLDLVAPIRDQAAAGKPIIGICLGQQLLMSESSEFGRHRGLDIIAGTVERLPEGIGRDKVPHVGWNRISPTRAGGWNDTPLAGLPDGAFQYFVHSYHVCPVDEGVVLARSLHAGTEFCASVHAGNIVAFQFHPERSGHAGLQIYRNLAAWINNAVCEDLTHV